MKEQSIPYRRLFNLHISDGKLDRPEQVVKQLGAFRHRIIISLTGLICLGPREGKQQSFVLPIMNQLSICFRDTMAIRIAVRY
jgi:hypothetical protein